MKQKIKTVLFIVAYLFLAYHFVAKVLVPTFSPEQQHLVNDFGSYYVASRLIADGHTPYRSTDNHHTIKFTVDELTAWQMNKGTIPAYIYPSFLAITLTPLSKLPFPEARLVWSAICTMCFFGCIFLTFYLLKRSPKFDMTTLLILFIFFASMPTLESFTLGQVNYPILLLMLLSFVFHSQKRSLLGGGTLAIASLVKVSPVLLLLYFLWRRDFRLITGFLLAFSVVISLMLILAPSVDIAFVQEVFPAISSRVPELNNKALAVWWQFLFTNNDLAEPIVHMPILASILSALSSIVIISSIAIVFKRQKEFNALDHPTYALSQFLVCCVGLLLVQPYLEIHHLVFAFPALACIITVFTTNKLRWQNITLLVLVFLLLNSRGENSFRWLGPHWYSAFLSNPQTYGLLIVLVLLCLIILDRISIKSNYGSHNFT